MEIQSQNKRILADLQQGISITPMFALRRYGTLRLSARIYDIKASGVPVRSKKVEVSKGKWVSTYWIEKDDSN